MGRPDAAPDLIRGLCLKQRHWRKAPDQVRGSRETV